MADAQQQFKIEEFRQLHEHIRTFETALATIFTVSLVACTTLLTAIFAWFFETYRTDPSKIMAALCYLFLSPALLSMLALALISSYKTAIYRNGYYIKVFFEEDGEGARWHVNLVEYRKLKQAPGEHGNPAAFMLWALHGISIGLFILGLVLTRSHLWHLAAPVPLVIAMSVQHRKFASNRRRIEEAWHRVRSSQAPPLTEPPARSAPGLSAGSGPA